MESGSKMTLEVERKYRITSQSEVRQRVEALGGRWEEAIQQGDQYFAHPARDFAATDEALRIRSVGPANVITYKGPKIDRDSKTREEIEVAIGPGQETARDLGKILERLGFRPVLVVKKVRSIANVAWQGRDVEVALDEVKDAGLFVELETQAANAELEDAKECIRTMASAIGLSETDQERRSYLEMVLATRGLER